MCAALMHVEVKKEEEKKNAGEKRLTASSESAAAQRHKRVRGTVLKAKRRIQFEEKEKKGAETEEETFASVAEAMAKVSLNTDAFGEFFKSREWQANYEKGLHEGGTDVDALLLRALVKVYCHEYHWADEDVGAPEGLMNVVKRYTTRPVTVLTHVFKDKLCTDEQFPEGAEICFTLQPVGRLDMPIALEIADEKLFHELLKSDCLEQMIGQSGWSNKTESERIQSFTTYLDQFNFRAAPGQCMRIFRDA